MILEYRSVLDALDLDRASVAPQPYLIALD